MNRIVKCSKAFFRIRGKVRHKSQSKRLKAFLWCRGNAVAQANYKITYVWANFGAGPEYSEALSEACQWLHERIGYLRWVWGFSASLWDGLSVKMHAV